jgi:serine/threonine protein kinase
MSTTIVTPQYEIDHKSKYKFRINETCLKYIDKYNIINYIACGSYGCTFQICNGKNCNYIVKIIDIRGTSEKNIKNEIKINKIAAEHDISPKIIDEWMCEGEIFKYGWSKTNLYFIVMEKVDITVKDYFKNSSSELRSNFKIPTGTSSAAIFKDNKSEKEKHLFIRLFKNLIYNLHKLDIVHLDLSPSNIMINLDQNGDIKNVKLIDFGLAIQKDNMYDSDMAGITDWQQLINIDIGEMDEIIYDYS